MPISDATVRMVKYPPELIPDSWFGAVPLLAEVAPPILDLKRIPPYLLALTGIEVSPNLSATVIMRLRYDDIRFEELTAAMPLSVATPMPGAWFLPAKQFLYLNLMDTVGIATYPIFYSVWAQIPTIAHKMVHGITLSRDEQDIANKLGVANSVDKGILPIPINQLMEREYYVLGEETKSRAVALPAPNTDIPIESIFARANEFIVLTRIAASITGFAQNVQVIIDRDDDHNYVTMPTFPLTTLLGGEVACFIPALSEIRLHALYTAGAAVAMTFRYTIKRIRLTNILRVRFGLVSKDEVPGDCYEKVVSGIL